MDHTGPERMKTGREFPVPLSAATLDVLERARKLSRESPLVFASRTGGPLPPRAPLRVLMRAGVAPTLHGFRSGVPAGVADAGLPHVPRSQLVNSDQRSVLLERRAEVFRAWSLYVGQCPATEAAPGDTSLYADPYFKGSYTNASTRAARNRHISSNLLSAGGPSVYHG